MLIHYTTISKVPGHYHNNAPTKIPAANRSLAKGSFYVSWTNDIHLLGAFTWQHDLTRTSHHRMLRSPPSRWRGGWISTFCQYLFAVDCGRGTINSIAWHPNKDLHKETKVLKATALLNYMHPWLWNDAKVLPILLEKLQPQEIASTQHPWPFIVTPTIHMWGALKRYVCQLLFYISTLPQLSNATNLSDSAPCFARGVASRGRHTGHVYPFWNLMYHRYLV